MMNNKFAPMNEDCKLNLLAARTLETELKELININDGMIEWSDQKLPHSFKDYPHIWLSNNDAFIDRIYVINNAITFDYHLKDSAETFTSSITDCGFNEWQVGQMFNLYDSVICREHALLNANQSIIT